jgi:hydroxymethylpyrimidine pyrophosphatase-like HAD family hydrolase
VKLSVLALDYDGTIARDDRVDPSVLDAIADARRRGIAVMLVTGRRLDDLRRVAGDLQFVDGVVAENGAVVHFPDGGLTTTLAPPIPSAFAYRLHQQSIRFDAGQCLVEADARFAPQMLEAIRELELPIVLVFNRSRVMVLTQGVSKATGLSAALETLRRSPRNAVAVGATENDHELLRLAEVGAAVEWGSPPLRSAADVLIAGDEPRAVSDFIRQIAVTGRMPALARARRRLIVGHTSDGHEFSLGVRGRNVLIMGETNSGKSWLAGLLCERLILHGYSLCVIDPEGDYRSLDALPGVRVLGGEDDPPSPRALLHALRYPDRSVVIDLSCVEHKAKFDYIRSVLPALNVMRRRMGTPHRIIVDEGHYFLRDAVKEGLLDLEFNGYTVVTYWPSQLPKELVTATEVILVTRESNREEIDALRSHCTACEHVIPSAWDVLPTLELDQAVALPVAVEAGAKLQLFTIGERLTPHVRHRQKYVDVPVRRDRAFVFRGDARAATSRAHTLREFVTVLDTLDATAADGYLRRGDFSRWIADVFGDHALARELQAHEREYVESRSSDVLPRIGAAIRCHATSSQRRAISLRHHVLPTHHDFQWRPTATTQSAGAPRATWRSSSPSRSRSGGWDDCSTWRQAARLLTASGYFSGLSCPRRSRCSFAHSVKTAGKMPASRRTCAATCGGTSSRCWCTR